MSTPNSGAALDNDTIAAVATAPGQAGIGVVRLSGPSAGSIARRIAGELPEPRLAALRSFRAEDGSLIDSGLVLSFPMPNSFTGEDVVEFQGHGGPVVLQLLLRSLIAEGARLARPGEFTERAYLNGKIDLAQAEAVADLIASSSETAVRAANRSLSGEFSRRVHQLDDEVMRLRTYVEAAIDFVDEDIDLLASAEVAQRIQALSGDLSELRDQSAQGVLLRDGIRLALLGAPNAGKSSLLNYLAGEERAIVTESPGTTRDLVRVPVHIGGLPVEVIDTAGLRDTEDVIEREGVRRALEQSEHADVVLWLADLTDPAAMPETLAHLDEARLIRVGTKADLGRGIAAADQASVESAVDVRISVVTGAGIDDLVKMVQRRAGFQAPEAAFTARQRHLVALDEAAEHLSASLGQVSGEIELVAEELRLAHLALGEIVGELTPDELLGEIFSTFCIGK